MIFSKEFIDFVNYQQPAESITKVAHCIKELISSLSNLKREFSNSLPSLFMDNNTKAIEECIKYGVEIDNFIQMLQDIDIKYKQTENVLKPVHTAHETDTTISDNSSKPIINPVKLGVVFENLCPKCNMKLEDSKTLYTTYTDCSKKTISKKLTTFTYRCNTCGRYFIHKDMLDTIDLEFTNIDPEYFSSNNNKKCIQCGEPVWNNTNYCWEHYKYHNSESK